MMWRLIYTKQAKKDAKNLAGSESDLTRQGAHGVERYVQGYIEQPERTEEVDAIRSVSYAALAEEPWD